ncbi:MAG: AAA domain-containing protein [Desulfobacterales bacterium]|nr:AAA domain-containing protein [Desulfobacterales bacterium]
MQLYGYLLGQYFLIQALDPTTAVFWDKFIYFNISLMPATYLLVLLMYGKGQTTATKTLYSLIYCPALFFIVLLWTPFLISGVQQESWGYGKVEGPAFVLFRIYLLAYFLFSIAYLYRLTRRAKGPRERNAVIYLWIGSGAPFLVTFVVTIVLQSMGINTLNVIAHPLSLILFAACLTYAMVKYHLFDLQIFFGPLMNNRRYTLYQNLKRAIRQVRRLTRFKDVIALLHKTLRCNVALNIKGHSGVAIGGGPEFRDFRLQENLLKKIEAHKNDITSLGQQLVLCRGRLPKGLEEVEQALQANSIEAIIPLYAYGRPLGILKFGPGFAEKAFSSQIAGMIDMFCNEFIASLSVIEAIEAELAEKDRVKAMVKAMQTPWKEVARSGKAKDYNKAILYRDEKFTFISDSSVMKGAVKKAGKAAKSGASVLLLGDTGTGKEIFARMIQHYSGKKMIIANCAAIGKDLIMSEIFGHEKGAFTDAKTDRKGRIEAAAGGILFLDEIGEMPEMTQAALLRVVEGGAYSRMGSNTMRTANVQFVAASNRGVTDQPGQAGIRRDLHSRFSVRIRLPSLWERKKDIPLLAEYFLDEANNEMEKKCRISDEAMRELCEHPLKGNVRDLQGIIHNVVMAAPADALIASIYQFTFDNPSSPGQKIRMEKRIELLKLLKRHGNSQAKAAAALGVAPSVLSREIKAVGLTYVQLLESLQRDLD